MKNNTSPVWKLDSIWNDIDSNDYKKSLSDYESSLNALRLLIEDFENQKKFDWIKKFLSEYNLATQLCSSLNAYAYIIYSTDTTNPKLLKNMNSVQEKSQDLDQIQLQFQKIISNNTELFENFLMSNPDYSDYKFLFKELIENSKHSMSDNEEKLAGQLSITGGSAWSMLQEQIISNLVHNEKTFNQLRNDAYSPDPKVREESYRTEVNLLKQNEIALAACLNNLKGETITLNSRRNWKLPIDRSLFTSRLSKQSLDSLITAIQESLPAWEKYFQSKAKWLKNHQLTVSSTDNEQSPGLAFYDLFAPLAPIQNQTDQNTNNRSLINKEWSFQEAIDYIIQEFSAFSQDMGNFAKYAFDHNWIDAQIRPGKVGGAYDEDFANVHESRILTNFSGSFSDIITLSHELGHAYHFHCLKGKDPVFFQYPMTLAETASTFAETLVKQHVISQSSGFEKIQMIETELQDVSQVLVDILCRYKFETKVFEKKLESELTSQDFCSIMIQCQKETYGQGLNPKAMHPYMWAIKSHYYITDFDFYNYPYAFGQLFAVALYQQFQKQGPSFAKTYAQLLSQTGNMSCEDLCKNAGLDITTVDFWKSAINFYIPEINTFQEFVDNE